MDYVVPTRILYTTPDGWAGSHDMPDSVVMGTQVTRQGATRQVDSAYAPLVKALENAGYTNVVVSTSAYEVEPVTALKPWDD